MKEIIILGLYFLLLGAIFGMATFLMFHRISGWGWLIFCGVLALNISLKVSSEKRAECSKISQ